jgi:hypothetical protein
MMLFCNVVGIPFDVVQSMMYNLSVETTTRPAHPERWLTPSQDNNAMSSLSLATGLDALQTTDHATTREAATTLANETRYTVYAMERKIKRARKLARLAEGLAGLMLDDSSINSTTTVAELLAMSLDTDRR